MFGLPQQEVSEEEKRAHQEQTEKTLKQAAYVAAFLWVSPMIDLAFGEKAMEIIPH